MTMNAFIKQHCVVSLGRAVRGAVAAGLLLGFATSIVPPGSAPPASAAASAADVAATVIARYRERIPRLMADQKVPGLAVALVDGDRALWVEGFGYRDHQGGAPVTADTIFSVQSMSKLFTATAVMQAVAAGRLDLDEPITTYLPEFTVHSAFQQHPERKITLRMLLSHTAGFTHEAPVGNNNQLDPGDFDVHVRSISDTWLRFPVGTGYAYSNLGIDLAGYILERVEGTPFAEVMRDSLLGPLAMDHSTFDRTVIRSTDDRAVGHVDPYPAPPVDVPMTAAGGLYTSAADLARFLRFQLSDGSIDGRVVLGPQWMDVMRTVSAPSAGAPAGYALGVIRHRWNRWDQRPDLFEHGGGGFGFISDLWWLPQLKIGIAILTNFQDHQLQGDLALSILADLVTEPGVYRDRLLELPPRPPVDDPNLSFEPPAGMANLVANAAMAATGDEATRWAAYSGPYRTPAWGDARPDWPAGPVRRRRGRPLLRGPRDGAARPPPSGRSRTRPVPRGQRRDARPARPCPDVAGSQARSSGRWSRSVAVGRLGDRRAPCRRMARRRRNSRASTPRVALGFRPTALRVAPLAPDRRSHGARHGGPDARKRGPDRVDACAGGFRLPRLARPPQGPAFGGALAAGASRPDRVHACSCGRGVGSPLVVE